MGERQDKFSGTMDVQEAHQFDIDRLTAYLETIIPDLAPPLTAEQFKGGQSNPTYKLTDKAGRSFVIRRKPPGKLLKSAHAVDREYRVITALGTQTDVAVARTYGLCEDEDVIGTMFYVMDCVDGRIFWEAHFPALEAAEREAYFDAMNDALARLHRVDPEAIGLGDYGKPGNYFERQIGRWSKQYLADEAAGRSAAMDKLVEWLPQHIPEGDETSIVHGDFRCDNMIFDAEKPEVRAILDWELSTLGHPLADFTYHLMMYRMSPQGFTGLMGLDLDALGIPSEASYVQRYCERTNRSGIAGLNFYFAYNMFRLAAILHGIQGRVVRGTAASAHAKQMGSMLEPLATLAWAQAERHMAEG
ncbi:MAG: phosphotransferase family protein [Pseudomonadota bacterium]